MNTDFSKFDLLTTQRLPDVVRIRMAFERKHQLEHEIAELIKNFEEETGLAIDMIKYQRDITIPVKGLMYTALSVIITSEK